jgi:hypothetical protein
MKIIAYLHDPYSIEQSLNHLHNLLTQYASTLGQHINEDGILSLEFGELDSQGNFFELQVPKNFRKAFPRNKVVTSEVLFFDILVHQNQFDGALDRLAQAVTEYNRNHPVLWADRSSFFGINILIPLSIKNEKYISSLIHYLSSTDLLREKTLSEDLDRIFRHHGWTIKTMELLAARATLLEGLYGHEHIKRLRKDKTLHLHLQAEMNQNILLEKLTEYALLNYSELEGEASPKDIIQRALQPFHGISETFDNKSQFLQQSFVEHFPNYLPCNAHLFNDPNP